MSIICNFFLEKNKEELCEEKFCGIGLIIGLYAI